MIDIVTYYSENAPIERCWLAQVVLPNGNYWGVYFSGSTEEAVKQKAIELWNKERSHAGSGSIPKPKPSGLRPCVKSDRPSPDSPPAETPLLDDPWASAKPAEKLSIWKPVEKPSIWMIHKDTREKICIPLTEITMYEKQGYVRGGPRGS